ETSVRRVAAGPAMPGHLARSPRRPAWPWGRMDGPLMAPARRAGPALGGAVRHGGAPTGERAGEGARTAAWWCGDGSGRRPGDRRIGRRSADEVADLLRDRRRGQHRDVADAADVGVDRAVEQHARVRVDDLVAARPERAVVDRPGGL